MGKNKPKDFYYNSDIDGLIDKKRLYKKLYMSAFRDNLLYLLYKYPLEKVKELFNKKTKKSE